MGHYFDKCIIRENNYDRKQNVKNLYFCFRFCHAQIHSSPGRIIMGPRLASYNSSKICKKRGCLIISYTNLSWVYSRDPQGHCHAPPGYTLYKVTFVVYTNMSLKYAHNYNISVHWLHVMLLHWILHTFRLCVSLPRKLVELIASKLEDGVKIPLGSALYLLQVISMYGSW